MCWLDAAAALGVGCFAVGISPWYTCPSSPGAKDRVEQKPSDEVMRSVSPSFDLVLRQTVYHKRGGDRLTMPGP